MIHLVSYFLSRRKLLHFKYACHAISLLIVRLIFQSRNLHVQPVSHTGYVRERPGVIELF